MSIEEVAAAAPDCYRWFKLYVNRDLEKTRSLVQRADKAGYAAIVLTVDLPVLGNRTSLQKIGFKVPSQFKMANMIAQKATTADAASHSSMAGLSSAQRALTVATPHPV